MSSPMSRAAIGPRLIMTRGVRMCLCKCCDHTEGTDCACDCHAIEPCLSSDPRPDTPWGDDAPPPPEAQE
jgi:hypothetical protein